MALNHGYLLGTAAAFALAAHAAPAAAQAGPAPTPASQPAAPAAATPPTPSNAPAAPGVPVDASSAPPSPTDGGEVIVTGSRISRVGYDAPTPTKVLSADSIDKRGLSNIGDYLNEVPSFRASQSVQVNPQSSLNAGQSYADLRGLGNIRTLTLVDGRRHVPSSATGQVDLNLIPTILIDRVDVVTGGASAAYGSDAVSGVVNLILNKRLEGFKGDVSYGETTHGDDDETRASLAFGTPFQDGRGHIVIGGDYVKSDGIGSFTDRDYGRLQGELVSYTGARAADQPSRFYAKGVQALNYAFGGVILGANADTNPANGVDALRGIQFGPGGTVQPFPYGTIVGTSAINFTGGDPGLYAREGLALVLPNERRVALAHLDYDITDKLSVFVEGNYGRSTADFYTAPVRDTTATGVVIKRDNAFLPAAVASIMDANKITSFGLGRADDDFGRVNAVNQNTTERFVTGFNAKLFGSLTSDGYFEYGHNAFDSSIKNLRVEQNFQYAVDSIRDGGGNAICRDATARAQGCVPINLFGQGSPSAAAIAYVDGTQFYSVVTEQKVGALNFHADPFSTWAGKVSIAFGGEYREESANAVSDKIAASNGYNYSNPKPFSGSYDVKEGYFEAVIPLARDLPFAKSIDLNGAVRLTDYSTSGLVTTDKVGATWEPIAGLRVRAAHSEDIRAPNNSELFAATSTRGTLTNTFSGVTDQIVIVNQSSPTLQPEKADTTTVGFAVGPEFLRGFNLSFDYYKIKVDGAISGYAPQLLIDNCAAEVARNAAGYFCSFVSRSGTGTSTTINAVNVQLLNLSSLQTEGVDFDASYRFHALGGQLTAGVSGNYTFHLIANDGLGTPRTYNAAGLITSVGSVVDRAGQVGGFTSGLNTGATGVPHLVLNTTLSYAYGPMTATVEGRYVGGGVNDKTLVGPGDRDYNPASPISIGDNRISDRFYVNLSGTYDIYTSDRRKVQLYGIISNLFDKDPPFPVVATVGLYDRIGRFIKGGVRFAY